jgi:predicted transcriptional regulator
LKSNGHMIEKVVMLMKKMCPKCGGTGKVIDDKALGRELNKKRMAKGVKLREVAREMKFSASYICDLEKGRRQWSADLEKKYRLALEV